MAKKDINQTADELAEEAKKCFALHDLEKATIALDKIAKLALTNAIDPLPLMKASNTRGIICWRRSDYKNAEKHLLLSLEYAKQVGEPEYIYNRYDNLAGIYANLDQSKKSVEYLELSRQLKEQTGNEKDMHVTLLNLTGRYMVMGNIEAAENNLAKSLFYIKKFKHDNAYSAYYFALAKIFETKQLVKESISSYSRSIKYALKFHDLTTAAKAYADQGEKYFNLGEWNKAESGFSQAYQIAKKHKLRGVELRASIQLASIALKKGDIKHSRDLYEYVRTNIQPSDFESLFQDLEELNALLNEAEGHYRPALEAYKKYLTYYKKQFDNETNRTIQDLQAKYEAEKKDRELEKAKLLQAQSELKALRAQMDPHFIFNALNSMRKELLEGNLEGADTYLVRFSKLLRLILDTTRTPNIRLSDNIELLHLYIQIEQARQGNRFDYTITTKGVDPDATYIPGLILQPLAENAIVHGLYHKKNGQGKLRISFSKSKDALVIKVKDNGVGRLSGKVKAKPGHTSHAMAIIRETLDLTWHGLDVTNYFTIKDLMTKDNVNIGTEVTVLLPLS